MRGINLIFSFGVQDKGFNALRRALNTLALVLGTVFLLSGGTVFYFFYSSGKEMTDNKTTISSLEKGIAGLSKNESYLITVDDRLSKIQTVLGGQRKKTKFLEDLNYISVPGFLLSSLDLSSSAKLIKLNFYCQDSQCLTNLAARAEELLRDKNYSQILLPGLTRDEQGRFNLSMEWKE